MVNLSDYQLTQPEQNLLNKGLNFIPTPTQDHEAKLIQDFLLFERKLQLYHALHKEPDPEEEQEDSDLEDDSPHKILHPSSGWTPPAKNIDPKLNTYKTLTIQDTMNYCKSKRKPRFNLKLNERKAIKSLKDNKNIKFFLPHYL